MTLFPLMGGKLSVKERIKTAFSITHRAKIEPKITEISSEDVDKIGTERRRADEAEAEVAELRARLAKYETA